MATQTTKTVQLPNMKIAAKQLDAIEGQISIGPVTITASVDPTVPDVEVTIAIFDFQVFDAELTPQDASVSVDLEYEGVGVTGTITADFAAQEVDGDLVVEVKHFYKKEWKGRIFSWKSLR